MLGIFQNPDQYIQMCQNFLLPNVSFLFYFETIPIYVKIQNTLTYVDRSMLSVSDKIQIHIDYSESLV